jgi:hypothetical protein
MKLMKRNILKITFACVFFFALIACDDKDVIQPDFSVQVYENQIVDKIGDTLICKKTDNLKFKIQGNPDMLVFFSGQTGNEYRYKDRTEIDGDPFFSFRTTLTFGTQFTGLKVYVSSTFPGVTRNEAEDRANIANMDYWQDITSQCNLPTTKNAPNNVTNTPKIDLSGFKGKPFYLAFRIAHPNGNESTWRIENLSIINSYKDVDTEVGTFRNIGFTAFDMLAASDPYMSNGNVTDKTNRRWDLRNTASNYIIGGGSNGSTIDNDDWTISAKIDLTKTFPDLGTAIKGFDNAPLDEYEYTYNVPGVYNITFVGSNTLTTIVKKLSKN